MAGLGGAKESGQASWVHPDPAIEFVMWLCVKTNGYILG